MPLTDNLHGKLLKTHATKTTDNENDDQPTDNIQQHPVTTTTIFNDNNDGIFNSARKSSILLGYKKKIAKYDYESVW